MSDVTAGLFLDFSVRKLEKMAETTAQCVAKLSDAQVWEKHGAHENAIGNLILHLCGNMRQWILHGVDEQPDVRTRDAEFSASGEMPGTELMRMFEQTTAEANRVIAALPADRLAERINPQNGEVAVLDAIYQVVGHVQQHVGQIILLTKQMTRQDLDLTMPRPR